MCTNGVNTGQFEQMISQIDDHIALERRWVHRLAHQAGDAGFTTVTAEIQSRRIGPFEVSLQPRRLEGTRLRLYTNKPTKIKFVLSFYHSNT